MKTVPKRETTQDALLLCMVLLARKLGRTVHLRAMAQGFALDDTGRVPLESYPDLASRHGMVAGWMRKTLDKVPAYVLPVLVPLVDGRACVLLSVKGDQATVWWAESGMLEEQVELAHLMSLARDEVLVVKAPTERSEAHLTPMEGKAFDWFWGTLWRFRSFYVESMVATVVANILTLANVFFTMNVYDRVVPTQAYASLWTLAIGTTLAIVLEFSMRWLKARLVDLGGKKADLAINATLLREVMSIRLEHRPQSVGIFASSMRDFESLRDFFSSASLVVLADLPFVVLFLAMIALVAGNLFWIPAAAIPILLIQGYLVQKPLTAAMRKGMKESGDKNSVLVESVLNLELLKAHNAESYLQRRWEVSNKAASDSYKEVRSLTNWMMGFTTSLQQFVTVAMVVAGVYMIHANQLTLGGLIAAVILSGRAIGPMASVMSLASRYQQAMSSLETLDGLIKRPHDREVNKKYLVPESVEGALEALEVGFAYPAQTPIPVIKKLSLKLAAGQRMALLGRVGSGKSTLLRIMAGLYAPTGGSVRLDGVEMKQIDPAEVRTYIGYVGQDPQLFMGTVRDNIVLSETWISDVKVVQALKAVSLYEMVAAHPLGLDMPISENGGGLSGGQRQLLSIARMMVRDPKLVFMDEPTANMDQSTEAHVIAVLRQWLEGRTVLMSTHRPQLLEWADSIAVIEGGQCVASGPKQAMIEQLSRGLNVGAPATPIRRAS